MAGTGTKVIITAIVGNGFITIIKFIGWFVSQSPSLLAEGIHSLADTLNQILLFIGMKHSKGESNRDHPQGKGEAQYVWNLVSAVGIFFIGFGVTAYHGLHALAVGHYEVGPISYIGIGVLIVAFIIEFYVYLQAYNEVNRLKGSRSYLQYLRENDDPTLLAVLLEDGVAVLGVVLALVGILLGQYFQSALFDIIASLAIALLMGAMAIMLSLINGKLLMGKSISIHKEEDMKKYILNFDEVENVESISTQILGAGKVRLTLELELHGHTLIDTESLKTDAKKISDGDDAYKVLHKAAERMIRLTGEKVNELEAKIQTEFPEVVMIDLEIH